LGSFYALIPLPVSELYVPVAEPKHAPPPPKLFITRNSRPEAVGVSKYAPTEAGKSELSSIFARFGRVQSGSSPDSSVVSKVPDMLPLAPLIAVVDPSKSPLPSLTVPSNSVKPPEAPFSIPAPLTVGTSYVIPLGTGVLIDSQTPSTLPPIIKEHGSGNGLGFDPGFLYFKKPATEPCEVFVNGVVYFKLKKPPDRLDPEFHLKCQEVLATVTAKKPPDKSFPVAGIVLESEVKKPPDKLEDGEKKPPDMLGKVGVDLMTSCCIHNKKPPDNEDTVLDVKNGGDLMTFCCIHNKKLPDKEDTVMDVDPVLGEKKPPDKLSLDTDMKFEKLLHVVMGDDEEALLKDDWPGFDSRRTTRLKKKKKGRRRLGCCPERISCTIRGRTHGR
jgi:hypothetical protein